MTADNDKKVPPSAGITMFPVADLSDWQEGLARIAKQLGFCVLQRGSALTIWKSEEVRPLAYGWRYGKAWRVARESCSRNQSGLAVKSVRVYFTGSSEEPTSLPESLLAKERYAAPNVPEDRIDHALEFGKTFASAFEGLSEAPVLFETEKHILEKTKMICQDRFNEFLLTAKHGDLIRANGFRHVPADFEIIVTSDKEADPISDEYAGLLAGTLEKFGVAPKVRRTSFKETWNLLDTNLNVAEKLKGKAVLVALEGQKGDGLSQSEAKLLDELERREVGFRMFSHLNRQLRFSCFNQISDLILVAGGIPYELSLPWPDHLKTTPFVIGVDLGHPRVGQSILSVVLCDGSGNLIKAWRAEQDRDETAEPKTLARLLGLAKFEMKRRTRRPENPVLVLRDGRLHTGETVATYGSHLSTKLSFCDLSKRPNVHPYYGGGSLPAPGTAYFPKASATAYFVSAPPVFAGQMSNLQKVHFPQAWDGLGIGLERLVEILIGLSYSPCLGLKPHRSPGPVHWADGFASISTTDCRFRGLGCIDSKKRTVRLNVGAREVKDSIQVFLDSSGSSTGVEGWEDPYCPSCKALMPKRTKGSYYR